MNDQTMGIQAVRRTSDKRTLVTPRRNAQNIRIIRFNNFCIKNAVCQCLPHHVQEKQISCRKLVQAGEETGSGQSPVSCKNTMCVFPSDRQTGSLLMSGPDGQYLFRGSVINRKIYVYSGNLYTSHDRIRLIQDTLIAFVTQDILVHIVHNCSRRLKQHTVVFLRPPDFFLYFLFVVFRYI